MKERTAVKKELALNKQLLQSYVETAGKFAKYRTDPNYPIYLLDVENEELIGYSGHLRSAEVDRLHWPSKANIIAVLTDIKKFERHLEKLNTALQNAGIQVD